jgi:hypothetical protein
MPNELFLVDTSVWIFALRKEPVEKPLGLQCESYFQILKKALS